MSRADPAAVAEDVAWAAAHDARGLWPEVNVPVLVVRAARPLGKGFIAPASDCHGFAGRRADRRVVEVDANHYGVMSHPDTVSAITGFLTEG